MNKLLALLILVTSIIYCQESLMEEEITLYTSNVPGQTQIIFTLDAIGTVWANSSITANYKIAKDTTIGNVNSYGRGWRIFWENTNNYFDPVAHGFYKMTTDYSNNYFYLNLRDCNWANLDYLPSYSTDFIIKYDALADQFYYANAINNYLSIPSKSVLNIWEIKAGTPVFTCFDNFWNNCIVLIPSQSGNHPLIVWGPYPADVVYYKIYRSFGGNYSLIHTTANENVFTFTDENYCIDIGIGNSLYYYVKAVYSSEQVSDPTNIVSTQAVVLVQQKMEFVVN